MRKRKAAFLTASVSDPVPGAPGPDKEGVLRTHDCASKIEYVTHSKWSPDEYKAVCSVLRMYRHQAIVNILDQARGGADDSESGRKPHRG